MRIDIDRVFTTPPGQHFFSGYYDKSPLASTNRRLLAQRASFMERMVEADDVLELGYFDWRQSGTFRHLGETRAWNWQQGCMLQWLGPDHSSRVIHNDRRDGAFVSVVRDLETEAERVLPMAVYTVNREGTRALCIDNERHYWFRGGYNYQGIANSDKKKPLDERDGIWAMDLETGETQQIINITSLLEIEPLSTMATGTHYLEHLMFSPSGKRFCFLHRWKMDDGGIYARLFTAGADGSDIRLLSDSGRMSHFSWLDDERIVAYGGIRTRFNRLRTRKRLVKYILRPILPLYHLVVPTKSSFRKKLTGDSYMILNDATGEISRLGVGVLCEDGHPTRQPGESKLIVSDTYEDEEHFRELFLFDLETERKVWTTKLKSIPELDSTSMRADLHPKWSFNGAYVAVDTMNDGHRSIYVYEVGGE